MPAWAKKKTLAALKHYPENLAFNVVKISKDGVSLLLYYKLMSASFPELMRSVTVRGSRVTERSYDEENPPILHRKELLFPDGHAQRARAERLTKRCEAAGLFENTRIIGRKKVWQEMLREAGIR
jgi:hypothetical protein